MTEEAQLEEWQAAGGPVVIMVPDHLGVDERCAYYAAPLLRSGIAVLPLDLPPEPGFDRHGSRLLLRAPHLPGRAEAILPALFGTLAALRAEWDKIHPGQQRPIGVLGFGPGGEAVLLAAHADGPMHFDAYAALYPTCSGPRLASLVSSHAPTAGAPILIVLASESDAGEAVTGCGALFDNPVQPDPFKVRTYSSTSYGFDLWPAVSEARARRDPHGRGGLDAARPDVATARLAREDVTGFFGPILRPAGPPCAVDMAKAVAR
jgi:dienelactone hydrolase